MSVYFDASVIVSLIVRDSLSDRAMAYIIGHEPVPIVSNFASAEVASAIGLRVRTRDLDLEQGQEALAQFDVWRSRTATGCEMEAADITLAEAFLRRLDLPLRAPDALHLATARRIGVSVATLDLRMAESAAALGVELAPI